MNWVNANDNMLIQFVKEIAVKKQFGQRAVLLELMLSSPISMYHLDV